VQFIELVTDVSLSYPAEMPDQVLVFKTGEIAVIYDEHEIGGKKSLEVVFPYAPRCSDLLHDSSTYRVLNPSSLPDAAIIAAFLLLHAEFVASVADINAERERLRTMGGK
jgi:hypothetical protein